MACLIELDANQVRADPLALHFYANPYRPLPPARPRRYQAFGKSLVALDLIPIFKSSSRSTMLYMVS